MIAKIAHALQIILVWAAALWLLFWFSWMSIVAIWVVIHDRRRGSKDRRLAWDHLVGWALLLAVFALLAVFWHR